MAGLRVLERRFPASLARRILLNRDPANTAPAEEAFLTAIAVAEQQKARSFELCAALGLARLYHSTDRFVDARALLAFALEGFSPNPEFPEIEEAQVQVLLTAPPIKSRRLPLEQFGPEIFSL